MIEVVTQRNEHLEHYRCTCATCKSDLRFTPKDLTYNRDPSGRGEGSAHLNCPVCNRQAAKFDYVNDEAQFVRQGDCLLETKAQYLEYTMKNTWKEVHTRQVRYQI